VDPGFDVRNAAGNCTRFYQCALYGVDLPIDRNKCLWLWGTTYLSERDIHWLCGM